MSIGSFTYLPEQALYRFFVTAYSEHALGGFMGAADPRIPKPFSRGGIAPALSPLQLKETPVPREWLRIPVKRKSGTQLLPPQDVHALVADLGDAIAWTAEGRLPIDGSLSHWEARLQEHGFLRIHRNALVRLGSIQELSSDDEVVLPSGRIPISRRRMDAVKRALRLG